MLLAVIVFDSEETILKIDELCDVLVSMSVVLATEFTFYYYTLRQLQLQLLLMLLLGRQNKTNVIVQPYIK